MDIFKWVCGSRMVRMAVCMAVTAIVAIGNTGCDDVVDEATRAFECGFEAGTLGFTYEEWCE